MLRITARTGKPGLTKSEVFILPFFEGEREFSISGVYGLGKEFSRVLSFRGFEGKRLETAWHYREQKPHAVLAVGLGKRGELKAANIFLAVAAASRELSKSQHQTGIFSVHQEFLARLGPEKFAAVFSAAMLYGTYQFSRYKEVEKHYGIKEMVLLTGDRMAIPALETGIRRGLVEGQAVSATRDLGNGPPNDMTPTHLAEAAQKLSALKNISVTVIDKKQFLEMRLGALWGVSKGSGEDAKFIVIEYRGADERAPFVGFVGKGITFDSGGISIKPSKKMDEMKFDMAGGAAVIGIMQAAARLRLNRNLVGIVPATENLPGGEAYKPGDVLRAYDGSTIEVLNTDAEGRVVLADALAYIRRYKPEVVIDFATLTGACVVALGSVASGLFTDDENLARQLLAAGEDVGERLWRLPLFEEYSEQVKSDIADVQNIGKHDGEAGASTGAAFLKHFAKGYPWAHLDIAGTAWATEERPYAAKGATGVGVRLALALLERL